ncbi:MAG: hypothetical protein WCF67_15300 [Chitinophagaceae bacterium]
MAYSFKHVTIYLFDINPAILLLEENSKGYCQTNFAFLENAEDYRNKYLANQPIETPAFIFSCLPNFDIDKSHFWKQFGRIKPKDGQPDFWSLQMPFVGRYKQQVELDHKLEGVAITVRPSIYLSTLGWSVNLKIDLRGNIKKTDLVSLIGWLSRGDGRSFSFRIGSDAMDKKQCFRSFNNLIAEEVYKNGTRPVPGMKIINQFVISINSFEGDIIPYDEMPSYEEALMRSILFGRQVEVPELENDKRKYPLTVTQISTNLVNFALTNFEQGSLIFLQREAKMRGPEDKEHKRKVTCFAENCKNCLMMSYLFWQFYTQSGTSAGVNDLAALKTSIPQTLKLIPQMYTSAFCKNLFLQHKGLAKFK